VRPPWFIIGRTAWPPSRVAPVTSTLGGMNDLSTIFVRAALSTALFLAVAWSLRALIGRLHPSSSAAKLLPRHGPYKLARLALLVVFVILASAVTVIYS
jgi:hypothetical protein